MPSASMEPGTPAGPESELACTARPTELCAISQMMPSAPSTTQAHTPNTRNITFGFITGSRARYTCSYSSEHTYYSAKFCIC